MAVNLAVLAARSGRTVDLYDCDVEEPNAHLFLKPEIQDTTEVFVPVPEVDQELCNACGQCGKICRFSAILTLGGKAMVYPELCHGCGGCELVCAPGAIKEVNRTVGWIDRGRAQGLGFSMGRLRVGEAMSPPLIRELLARVDSGSNNRLTIVDAPPGTSCPVVSAVRKCDYALLVTEPTPFGLNDLKLAVGTVREIGTPLGVVINRCDVGDDRVVNYCRDNSIEVLAQLPNDRAAAEAYSRGELLVDCSQALRKGFEDLLAVMMEKSS